MKDIKNAEYAEWLEDAIREMVELEPETIGIVMVMPDGTTGSRYYNADNRDRLVMMEALMIDYLDDLIQVNADHLRELLMGEDEE